MKSSSTTSVRSDSTEETSQPSSSGSGSASGLTVASNIDDKSTTSSSANTVSWQSTIELLSYSTVKQRLKLYCNSSQYVKDSQPWIFK